MYSLLAVLNGLVIAVMLVVNGVLTNTYSAYLATVIIHVTGLTIMLIASLVKKEKIFSKRGPWYFYLGGAIGVGTTVCNNFAFAYVSVSAMLACELLGQSLLGAVVDQYGLFHTKKDPMTKRKFLGLILVIVGIAIMMVKGEAQLIGIVLCTIAGASLVLSRITYAKLSEKSSLCYNTTWNYIIGLGCALLLLIPFRASMPTTTAPWYAYLGGMFGIITVLLSTVVVNKIPQVTIGLLNFIGQVFSGLLLDYLLSGTFSMANLIGGLFAALGVAVTNLKAPSRQAQ